MFNRKKFKYIAVIQRGDNGKPSEVEFECYWSPAWEGIFDAVANAAASIAWHGSHRDHQQRTPYAGITARLAEEDA